MKHGSLFSGYGGLDLAISEVFGARTVWFSEVEDAPSKVLQYHWSDVPNLGDITKIDWYKVSPIDILSGGSPCQDLSQAGKRKGMSEGTRSGLWESMREGIAVLRPKFVVWENVKGALSAKASSNVERTEGRVGGLRALGRVLGDLASLGYGARWGVVRASDAGAPHRRERVFVLAHDASDPENVRQQRTGQFGAPTTELRQTGGTTSETLDFDPRWGTAPEPLIPAATKYGHKLNPRFSEWVMGLPYGWVDVPGVSVAKQHTMIGNGVCPPQAALALRTLLSNMGEVTHQD